MAPQGREMIAGLGREVRPYKCKLMRMLAPIKIKKLLRNSLTG
jgi:hypothetical protein